MFLHCLAGRLSSDWGKSFGTNFCFHASCVHWRSETSFDDGAGFPNVSLVLAFYCDVICNLLGGVTNSATTV